MLQKGVIGQLKYNAIVANIYLCDIRSSINMILQTLRGMPFWCEGPADRQSGKLDQAFQRLHDTIDRRFDKRDAKSDKLCYAVVASFFLEVAFDTYLGL